MKKISTKISKTAFSINIPETVEEYASIHGDVNACLEQAIKYDVAHTILGKIRTEVGARLTKLGATRAVSGTDSKGEPIFKAIDIKWLDSAFIELGLDAAEQSAMYQDVADAIGYNVSGSRGNKEFNAIDLKEAKELINYVGLGKTNFQRIKANLEARNPGLVLELDEDSSCTPEVLAAALKVERARAEAERRAQISGLC